MLARPLVVLAALALTGCASDPCTVKQAADGSAVITCPDGSVATLAPGADGADGAAGADGRDGASGQTGQAGADGASVAVRTDEEPAGENCPEGGVAVRVGLDDDGDGALDDAEIDDTSYVCDGADGHDILLRTSEAPPDDTCPAGGVLVEAGIDSDDDGVLADEEVSTQSAVCNAEAMPVALAFPSNSSVTPDGYASDYGYYWTAGDDIRESFSGTGMVSVDTLDLEFYLIDSTYDTFDCIVGELGFDVSLNGTVVGSFSYAGGYGYGYYPYDLNFVFPRVYGTGATGDDYEIAITATSTVCVGGGAWQWYPYGTTTMSM